MGLGDIFRRNDRSGREEVDSDEERTGTQESGHASLSERAEYTQSSSESKSMDSWKADLSAQGNPEAWEAAREKTLAAKNEAANAQLAGKKASHELKESEKAALAVETARTKHREALQEAEKLKTDMNAPSGIEGDVGKARELYTKKQAQADDAERALREAEERLAALKAEQERLQPQVKEQAQMVPGLKEQYEGAQRERKEAEGEVQQLAASAQSAQQTRSALSGDLDKLQAQLEAAEQRTAAKQREYLEARNASQALAERLKDLKNKLQAADEELDGKRGQAHEAREQLPAYKEDEAKALRELRAARSEWQRLKQAQEEQARGVDEAAKRVKELQGQSTPAASDLGNAERALAGKQDDLEEARQRAAAAQEKYDELQHLAELHAQDESSAMEASKSHTKSYEEFKEDTSIHSSKHDEYWREAKQLGDRGNTSAFKAEEELVQKVQGMMKGSEQAGLDKDTKEVKQRGQETSQAEEKQSRGSAQNSAGNAAQRGQGKAAQMQERAQVKASEQ